MRFDDRLKTVLAQPSADAHDCAVRWRQLVDLVARAGRNAQSPLLGEAMAALKDDWERIDEGRRAAAARAIAGYALPLELLGLFAADNASVSAPVLTAATLQPDEWQQVLAEASDETRRLVSSLHPDVVPPARKGRTKAAPEAPPAEPAAAPSTPHLVPSISDVVARIERLRHTRPAAPRSNRPPMTTRSAAGYTALFRWECGPSGEIAWVEGAPRGALIGRSIARSEDEEGVDEHVERAFAMRAPFRDATLTLAGDGSVSGLWKISGIPAFEPNDGRFAGYRGVAMRDSPMAAAGLAVAEAHAPLDPDTLRELVHEIKTPLNAIIGFAEIIDGQYLGPADTRYRERAAEIVVQARLLVGAIDDLDLAARLQSGREQAAGSLTFGELFAILLPPLREQATARGAAIELDIDPDGRCEVAQSLATRLFQRFLGALVATAANGDRLRISGDRRVGRCRVWIDRPTGLKGVKEPQLLDPAFGNQDAALPLGISLRLVRGLARIAGGDLIFESGRIGLTLPG